MLYCFVNSEEHLTSGLCLKLPRKPKAHVNIQVVSAIIGMHRLSFKNYFWVVVLEAKVV